MKSFCTSRVRGAGGGRDTGTQGRAAGDLPTPDGDANDFTYVKTGLPRRRVANKAVFGAICVFALLAGCTKNAASIDPKASSRGAGGTLATAASVCDRHILKIDDVGGILSAPITETQPLPGDAQSCEFITATFPAIIVSLRPGLGRTTIDAWATGKMPLQSTPLPGVGDGAVWVETLHEVVAQKNALLCDIQVKGGGSDLAANSKALPGAVGALCNKIFASY
jgi:hypothetical protein